MIPNQPDHTNTVPKEVEGPATISSFLGELKVEVGPNQVNLVTNEQGTIKLTFAQLEFINKMKQKFGNING